MPRGYPGRRTRIAERADAVVVGAGPNGLAAAALLARGGLDVVVLEAQDRLGGAVATEELTLPGFRHDTFSAVYPAAAASPVFRDLRLEDHGLRWVHPPVPLAHVLDDGRAVPLHRSLDATCAALDALAAGDGARWREFAVPHLEHFGALRDTMLSGFPPLKGPAQMVARRGPYALLEFVRLLLTPAHALGERLFSFSGARAWLFGQAMHGDVPPEAPGSGIAGAYLALLGHTVGWPSPAGGAQGLADALVRAAQAAGARCRTGARVVRVHAEHGRVRGVEIAGGERIEARVVVADLVPAGLLEIAGDALPSGYRERLAEFRRGLGTVKVDWALDGPVPWTAEEAHVAGTVHVGGDAEAVAAAVRAGSAPRELPDRPFLLLGQQSVADPSRAPAGKHTVWAYTHIADDRDWAADRERFADVIEEQVERYAPGFRDRILARHILDPGDLQRRDANLLGGDVGGGSYALDQLVFRPVAKLSPYRTALRGLYLGSAATFPGGAVHGVPGAAAARAALWDVRLRRVGR